MASRFPSAWLDELRSRSDIVQIVSGYVGLKKTGKNYLGLCPFHGEKTASFTVDGEKQLYYCFGCKAGGNVINFVMEIEHLDFHDAVEFLAERAHIPMPEMENDEDYERRRTMRERLLAANKAAARIYHETLYSREGEGSLSYLKSRGLNDGIIRRFGLGASPDRRTFMSDRLMEQGFASGELVSAGIAVPNKDENGNIISGIHDMFRNRAIFPIIDMYGNVLAFGGRTIEKREPKYLNTADTPVFNKRRGVYAANLLRKQRHLDRVILVEGYMDVVSLSQFGVIGVCATLGTSLTNEQARLMRRFAPKVYLAYDGDSAGQHAILRGLEIMESEGVPVSVLDFPDGLDPDEFIRRDGIDGFRSLPTLTPAAYRLRRLRSENDLSTDEGKVEYARNASRIISRLDPVERESYLKEVVLQTGFPRETFLEQIRREKSRDDVQPYAAAPVARTKHTYSAEASANVDECLKAQETLIALLATGQIPESVAEEKDFDDDELKSIYVHLMNGGSASSVMDMLPDDDTRSRFSRILSSPLSEDTDQLIAMASECVSTIRRSRLERRLKEIEQLIDSAPDDKKSTLLIETLKLRKTMQAYARQADDN